MSKVDLTTRAIVKTVRLPAGSAPWMLRVSPDGRHVWVQTGTGNTNTVLDADTLAVLQTTAAGNEPVEAAFQPAGGRYGLVTHLADSFILVLDSQTGAAITRIEVGGPQANASFSPDGAFAYVTAITANQVIVVDMAQLTLIDRIPTGKQPMGIVLLDPAAPLP